MNEDFLQFVWHTRRFDQQQLTTTEGASVQVLNPGTWNKHDGPDFLDARIKIGETLWAGHVEMHTKASEWLRHNHQNDPAFDNVILHVVFEEDEPVRTSTGSRIPGLELKNRIPDKLWTRYLQWQHGQHWIPCQTMIDQVGDLHRSMWLDRLLVERLQAKTSQIGERLAANGNDWEETFYQFLARNFGLTANAGVFEELAVSIPQRILARHKDQLLQLEALLFGQSGLLHDAPEEEYTRQLRSEYEFLRKKYKLTPLPATRWKWGRLHPGNFPTVRLAQFARLVQQSAHLFSKILEVEEQADVEALFSVELDGYWKTHFTFGKPVEKGPKRLGPDTIRLLTINSIAPFLFYYGSTMGEEVYKDKALHLLEQLPPEKNHLIKGWEALGWKAANAFETQALLHLKKNYCDQRQCLHCAIGAELLK